MSTRQRFRHIIMAASALIVLALSACQPHQTALPSVTSELLDSAWPVVVDDIDPDRVVDATHALITRYLATTDTITRDGGEEPDRMARVVTEAWFPSEAAAFAHYRAERLRTVGDTTFDSLVIQSVSTSVTGSIHIDAIACVDASWVWLLPREAPDPPEGLVEWLRHGSEDGETSEDEFAEWSDYVDIVQPIPGERQAIVLWLVGADLNSLAIDGTINWEGAATCHTTVID
jgi:hypothetical protein